MCPLSRAEIQQLIDGADSSRWRFVKIITSSTFGSLWKGGDLAIDKSFETVLLSAI